MKLKLILFFLALHFAIHSFSQCNPTIQFNNLVLCPNTVDTLKIQGTFSSIQWWKDNAIIAGATNNQLIIDPNNYAGSYVKAQVTAFFGTTACSGYSDSVLVDSWVFMPPFLSSQGNFQTDPNTGETVVCAGDTFIIELSNTYSQNIQWFNNGVLIPGATSNQFLVQQSGSYTASGSPSICPNYVGNASIPVDVNVIQSNIPQITATNLVVCPGSPVTLTANPSTNLEWNTGSTLGTIQVTQAGVYWARGVGNYGCMSDTSNQIVLTSGVAPNVPTITALGLVNFCEGDSVLLSASGSPNTYLWNNGVSASVLKVTQSGLYFVKSIGINGCTSLSSDTILVQVNPKPTAPIIQVNGLLEFCEGDSVLLSSNYNFGNTWNSGSLMQQIVVKETGLFMVKHTDVNGCQSDWSNAIQTFENSLPVQANITQSADTLYSNVSGNYFYQWYYNTNPITGETLPYLKVTQNGNYQVKITQMAQGCSALSEMYEVVGLTVKESDDLTMMVYPNPAKNQLNVKVNYHVKQIKLYDIEGRNCTISNHYNNELDTIQLNIQYLKPGAYYLIVETVNDFRMVKKVVIMP